MQSKEKEVIKEKAKFFFSENLKCHVKRVPNGFINGMFKSCLIDDIYYLFEEFDRGERKLFLSEIYDIFDYRGEVKDV